MQNPQTRIRLKVKTDTELNIMCTACTNWKVSQLYSHLEKLFKEVTHDQLYGNDQKFEDVAITKIMQNQYYIPRSVIVGQIFKDGDQIFCVVGINSNKSKTQRILIKKQEKNAEHTKLKSKNGQKSKKRHKSEQSSEKQDKKDKKKKQQHKKDSKDHKKTEKIQQKSQQKKKDKQDKSQQSSERKDHEQKKSKKKRKDKNHKDGEQNSAPKFVLDPSKLQQLKTKVHKNIQNEKSGTPPKQQKQKPKPKPQQKDDDKDEEIQIVEEQD